MITQDDFFLRTIQDLDERSASVDDYDLLVAAALLRKLLLDGNCLMDQVNRSRHLSIRFRIVLMGPEPRAGEAPPVLWALPSGLDPTTLHSESDIPIVEVDKSRFLSRPVSVYAGEMATVHDLIDYFAHVRGAVHSTVPKTNKEKALRELESFGWTDGVPLILEILRSVIRITVHAMRPLVEAVA